MTSNTKPPYGFMADYAVGQGYVYYEHLKDNNGNFWRGVGNKADRDLNSKLSTNLQVLKKVDLSKTATILRNLGEIELDREMEILTTHFGMKELARPLSLNDYPKFIRDINLIMGIGDKFKDYLNLLDQHSKKNSDKKTRAPVAASYFGSNFETLLNQRIIKIFENPKIQNDIINGDYDSFKKRVEKSFDPLILKALEKTAKTSDKLFDKEDALTKKEVQIWQDIIKLKNSLEFQPFKEVVYQRFNLDKIVEGMFEWKKERLQKNNLSNRGSRKQLFNIMFTDEKNYRNVAGFIGEFLHEINVDVNLTGNKQTATKTLKKNIARTDSITLYESSIEIEFSNKLYEELEKLDNSLIGSTLEKNRKPIEDFTREFLNKSDKNFIKYTSTKVSSLGENFEKYGFGTKTKPEEIMNLLDRAGVGKTDDLLEVIYNTGKGALLENKREIRDEVKKVLVRMVAYILFDDWESFEENQKDRKVIHIFNLNRVMVPLSYLLFSMSDAIDYTNKNLNKVFSIHLSVPKIKFTPPINTKEKTMEQFWQEQATHAKHNTNLSIQFISNFKTLIAQMLNSYN